MTPYETHAANATTPPPQDHHAPSAEPSTRRAGDQWIRDALKENKSDVHLLRTELTQLHNELKMFNAALNSFMECALGSIPNKDPKAHLTAHERLALEEAEKQKKREESEKTKREMLNGALKTMVQVALGAVGVILMLGIQAQFSLWVNSVKAPTPAAQTTGVTK